MTTEAQRIAIAEICGWKIVHDLENPSEYLWHQEGKFDSQSDLPDYPNDLNAMHQAESKLTPWQRERFVEQLDNLTCLESRPADDQLDSYRQTLFILVHTNPAQRAKAFLRTLDKLTEDEKGGAK